MSELVSYWGICQSLGLIANRYKLQLPPFSVYDSSPPALAAPKLPTLFTLCQTTHVPFDFNFEEMTSDNQSDLRSGSVYP